MQGKIDGKHGIAVIIHGGSGQFEATDGETYSIELRTGGQVIVTQDVWDEDEGDWIAALVTTPWETFARLHNITTLVS